PRVPRSKLAELYRRNAAGIDDPELLAEVASILYMRCADIIAIYEAHYENKVRCPGCLEKGAYTALDFPRGLKTREKDAYAFVCPACGAEFTWEDFRRSHHRRQLNIGGAGPAFRRFVERYEAIRGDDRSLMLEVDRVIHAFHYHANKGAAVESIGRIAGCNLIDCRNMTETIKFLDELSEGVAGDDALADSARAWREGVGTYWRLPERGG
ncbi:MAG: hypothetical protein FWE70_02450, partial [Oscillospiraceae bacterium]|nr:hypothetical protein [Oscillospiraceae bacterium]